MISMGGCASGNHAAKISGGDGVDVSTADPDMFVRITGADPARSHGAVFAAGGTGADWTRFDRFRPIKEKFYPVSSRFGDHLLGGFTGSNIFGSNYLFRLSHNSSMVWI
jgi:hypothetical protein